MDLVSDLPPGDRVSVVDLVPGLSLDNLLQQRDAMVERICTAHRQLKEAAQIAAAMFGDENRGHTLELQTVYNHRHFTDDGGELHLIREVDGRAWGYLLEKSGLRTFLDAAAREKWRKAIQENDVPPLTRANIEATFSVLYETRGEMFERGVVAVFRALSWDYKTNSPVAFGKRLILRHIVCSWTYGVDSSGADKFDDLIRVMSVLDGKPEPDHRQGAYQRLRDAQWPKVVPVADLDYFTVRGFRNGNGHLTFTRPDLVDRLNQILAKHHPRTLGAARAA